ncbi:Aflatoxin biosynthesis regulatory protein [Penicillium alfredii]|uniref:Aflatoxin biosynthesis regulatory protein n=1 Tax=Penicillium alfredii TaxID=1506179 RepID=A0A9W9F9J3_9EURO|nr:Aflatoxin biosynthesis regulatory protein [Penicillium alfredii]KAJ5096098.1 Aflatoxin biosynthesis regulatory protein [Penicillium alfredii]
MRRVKKSRNGCARCKSKRVKCGEEKPHCTRCTRLGVRCPGYVQSLRWVTKYEQSSSAASIPDATAPSPAASSVHAPQSKSGDRALPPADNADAGPSHDANTPAFGFDESNALCDNLWHLPGHGSLPELTDLCPPPSVPAPSSSFVQPGGSVYDFGTSGDTAADLSRILSLIGPAPNEQEIGGVYRNFSPSAIVRSYPPTAPPPPRDFMSISRPLNNPSWTLIEYYFKEVAALFSSYDSQMNPFRTTVSRLWGSSLAMCRTMQSMAAATLVNDFPQFGPMGRKMRNEAVDIITRDAVMDDKALLALLMLGQTASWHDPTDLGISFFNLLRRQLNSIGSSNSPAFGSIPKDCGNNYRFFEEALIYWEMLLSFVADNDSMVLSDHSRAASSGESLVLQRVPHPWTGIARDTQFTVHEVGRLVRRERKRIRSRQFTSQADISRAQMAVEKARELEDRLLGLAHPSEAEIVSPGDDDTPVWHLLTMAEVYRCTGLMQLYRVFPDLLRSRLPGPDVTPQCPGSMASSSTDPFFPIDLDSMDLSAGFCDNNPDDGTHPNPNSNLSPSSIPSPGNIYTGHFSPENPQNPQGSAQESANPSTSSPSNPYPDSFYDNWLAEFAITTLSRLKTIPIESRTRCLQPFLLVASCSELRLPHNPSSTQTQQHASDDNHKNDNIHSNTNNDNDNETHDNHLNPNPNPNSDTTNNKNNSNSSSNSNNPSSSNPSISMEAIEVLRARRFILGRLTSFLHVLPPKPINVCLRLVREVWRRMDAGEADGYWIDVMIEKGWETTMG